MARLFCGCRASEGLPNHVRVASYHLPLIHTYPQAETYKRAVTYQLLCKNFT